MTAMRPWEVEATLTEERLIVVGQALARSREECLLHYTPEKGDDAWSHGCRAYRWACFAIRELHRSGLHPWLAFEEDKLVFSFSIGGVALKMFKGDAENPSARSLQQGLTLSPQQNLFELVPEAAEAIAWFWLMAIETDVDGHVLRVVIVQTNTDRDLRVLWSIPLDRPVAVASSVVPFERQGVDLPPAAVGPKSDEASKTSDTDDASPSAGDGNDNSG